MYFAHSIILFILQVWNKCNKMFQNTNFPVVKSIQSKLVLRMIIYTILVLYVVHWLVYFFSHYHDYPTKTNSQYFCTVYSMSLCLNLWKQMKNNKLPFQWYGEKFSDHEIKTCQISDNAEQLILLLSQSCGPNLVLLDWMIEFWRNKTYWQFNNVRSSTIAYILNVSALVMVNQVWMSMREQHWATGSDLWTIPDTRNILSLHNIIQEREH